MALSVLSMQNPLNQTPDQAYTNFLGDQITNPTGTPSTFGDWFKQNEVTPQAPDTPPDTDGGGYGGLVTKNGQLGTAGAAWGLGLGTLQAGFGLYSGLKQLSLANKEFKLNKAIATQNMNNEVKQYNTNLQTTAGLRSSMEGTGGPNSQAANSFYNDNKLTGV